MFLKVSSKLRTSSVGLYLNVTALTDSIVSNYSETVNKLISLRVTRTVFGNLFMLVLHQELMKSYVQQTSTLVFVASVK